jgi:hypothetical protein
MKSTPDGRQSVHSGRLDRLCSFRAAPRGARLTQWVTRRAPRYIVRCSVRWALRPIMVSHCTAEWRRVGSEAVLRYSGSGGAGESRSERRAGPGEYL